MLSRKMIILTILFASLAVMSCGSEIGIQMKSGDSIYSNLYLPQDFGLEIPLPGFVADNDLTRSDSRTVDLNKCYVDERPSSGEVNDHIARLCGIYFEQLKLELDALMLDLALPHVRALCHNKLPDCDLEGQVVTITISEPVMRRIEQLYEYYEYVGMEDYFQYNGMELKNGTKIPYTIQQYQEIEHPVYDYVAHINRTALSTQGENVEQREDSAYLTVYWNKSRHNIMLEFRTMVDVFDHMINARRVYENTIPHKKLHYISQIDYWNDSMTFRYNHSMAIQESGNCGCGDTGADFYSLGGQFYGLDAAGDGLAGDEISSAFLRVSKGHVDTNGGMVENMVPENSSSKKEQILFGESADIQYRLEAPLSSYDWQFALSSPSTDWGLLSENGIYSTYTDENGMMILPLTEKLLSGPGGVPAKSSYWLAAGQPEVSYLLKGFGFSGQSVSIFLDWSGEETSSAYNAVFLLDGGNQYTLITPDPELVPLEY